MVVQCRALRAFEVPGHGKASKGDRLILSRESADYLLAYNTDNPLIAVEDFDGATTPAPEGSGE